MSFLDTPEYQSLPEQDKADIQAYLSSQQNPSEDQNLSEQDKADIQAYLDEQNKPATIGQRAKDVGIDVLQGAVDLGQAGVGLLGMATGGLATKGFKAIGYDAQKTNDFLASLQSHARQVEEQDIQNAKGAWDTTKALLKHPAALAGRVARTVPGMLGIMGAARYTAAKVAQGAYETAIGQGLAEEAAKKIAKEAAKKYAIVAASGSEGAQQAGQSFDQLANEGVAIGKNYVSSLGSGLMTAGIAGVSGGVASKIGLGDIEAGIAGEGSRVRRIVGGMIQEGPFEEGFQGAEEQMWQNWAEGKPIAEGAVKASVTGSLVGALAGGGFAAVSPGEASTKKPTPDTVPSTVQEQSLAKVRSIVNPDDLELLKTSPEKLAEFGLTPQDVEVVQKERGLLKSGGILAAGSADEAIQEFHKSVTPASVTPVRTFEAQTAKREALAKDLTAAQNQASDRQLMQDMIGAQQDVQQQADARARKVKAEKLKKEFVNDRQAQGRVLRPGGTQEEGAAHQPGGAVQNIGKGKATSKAGGVLQTPERLAKAIGKPEAAKNAALTGQSEEQQIKHIVDDAVKQKLDIATQLEAKGHVKAAAKYRAEAKSNGAKLKAADGITTENAVDNILKEDQNGTVQRRNNPVDTSQKATVQAQGKETAPGNAESNKATTEKQVVVPKEPKPVVPESNKEPWKSSDLATAPNISDSAVKAEKQSNGKYKLFYRGTQNEVFKGEVFKTSSEARNFFKVQKLKAQQATPSVSTKAAGSETAPAVDSIKIEWKKKLKKFGPTRVQDGKLFKQFSGGKPSISEAEYEEFLKNASGYGYIVESTGLNNLKPETAPAVKQPWEMTRDEYKKESKRLYEKLGNSLYVDSNFHRLSMDVPFELHQEAMKKYKGTLNQNHYKIVKQALSEGKSVPEKILAEYPDLKAEKPVEKQPAPQKAKEKAKEKAKVPTSQITPHPTRKNMILVKGDQKDIRAKLKAAGIKVMGLRNAKLNSLVFNAKHEQAIRKALEEVKHEVRKSTGSNAPVHEAPTPQEDTTVWVVSGYPKAEASKVDMLAAIKKAKKQVPERTPKDGFSLAERIDWNGNRQSMESGVPVIKLPGGYSLRKQNGNWGLYYNQGSLSPEKISKDFNRLSDAKIFAEYYLLGKTEDGGHIHIFKGDEYEFKVKNSEYALDMLAKRVKGTKKIKFSKAPTPQEGSTVQALKTRVRRFLPSQGIENLAVEFVQSEGELPKGVLPAIYHRFYDKNTPMSNWGHAMFAEDAESVNHYGRNHFLLDTNKYSDTVIDAGSREFKDKLAKALEKYGDDYNIESYGEVTPDLIRGLTHDANPDDIVSSAGLWDSDLISLIWDHVLEPNNWDIVKTSDGAIVFDPVKIDIAKETTLYSKNGDIQGYFDPATNTITLVADNVPLSRAWPILLHESTHKVRAESGWAGVFGKRSKAIMAEIDRKIKVGAKSWKQAEQKARDAGTPEADMREETITYWLASQANSKMPLWKRIANSIRAFLVNTGIKRKVTDADILGLAENAVMRRAKRRGVSDRINQFAQPVGVMLSKAIKKITDNPNFKKWFGDSKIVDKNGEPLVVYHGTTANFISFAPSTEVSDIGFHFGTIYQAESRLENKAQRKSASKGRAFKTQLTDYIGSNIMPVYLSIKNPLILPDAGTWGASSISTILELKKDQIDPRLTKQQILKIKKIGYSTERIDKTAKLKKYLEALGYDGITYLNKHEGSGTSYIAFKPTQIKSIYNTGEFSPTNPDIRYSKKTRTFEDIMGKPFHPVDNTLEVINNDLAKSKTFKIDFSHFDTIFKTPEYYAEKIPAAQRYLDIVLGRKEHFHKIQHRLLGGFHQLTKKVTGKPYEGLSSYFDKKDMYQHGYRIKYESDDRVSVLPPRKSLLGGIKGGVGAKTFNTEQEAIAYMIAKEAADYKKSHPSATDNEIALLMDTRRVTNEAFNVLTEQLRQRIEESKRQRDAARKELVNLKKEVGVDKKFTANQIKQAEAAVKLKDPDAEGILKRVKSEAQKRTKANTAKLKALEMASEREPTAQINGEEINLRDVLNEMGDLRGSYMPRIRKPGGYTLLAHKKVNGKVERFAKNYDLYSRGYKTDAALKRLAKKGFNRLSPIGREKARLEKAGYTVDINVNKAMSESIFDAAQLVISVENMIKEGVSRAESVEGSVLGQQLDRAVNDSIADLFRMRGFRSTMMRRNSLVGEGVYQGYEKDLTKRITQYANNVSSGIAKRDMAKGMILALTGRDVSWSEYKIKHPNAEYKDYQEFVRKRAIDPVNQKTAYTDLMSHMKEMLRNDQAIDRLVATAKGLAVHKYLGFRVSSGFINLTNMAMNVPAAMKLIGKISYHRTYGLINHGMKAYMAYRTGHGALSAADRAFLDEVHDRGYDDAQFNEDAYRALLTKLQGKWHTFATWSMWFFGETEQLNRGATHLAAYNGIRPTPSWNGKGIDEKRLELAHEVSDKAHGVYDKATRPAITRGAGVTPAIARSAYTFAKFQHNYLQLLLKAVGRGGSKAALAHLLISPAIIGGAGASLLTPLLSGLAKALGIGGDDPEEEYYKWAEDTFGSDTFARFGLPGLLGFSVKGSLAMNWPSITIEGVGGAPLSVVTDEFKGAEHLLKGDISKGLEKMLPTGLGSPFRAYREATEGVTTSGNVPVFYGKTPIKGSPLESMWRVFAFAPARTSKIREKQWSEKKIAREYSQWKHDIYSKYRKIKLGGNASDLGKVMREIKEFNIAVQRHPEMSRITRKSLRQALRYLIRPPKRERMRGES